MDEKIKVHDSIHFSIHFSLLGYFQGCQSHDPGKIIKKMLGSIRQLGWRNLAEMPSPATKLGHVRGLITCAWVLSPYHVCSQVSVLHRAAGTLATSSVEVFLNF